MSNGEQALSDSLLKLLFGQDPSAEGERQRVIDFFPVGCFLNWDGQGVIPIGSLVLMRNYRDVAEACVGCQISDCSVRKAPAAVPVNEFPYL